MNDSLMKARLGIYEKKPYQNQSVTGLNDMATRFTIMGGYRQQDRMIHDKRCSLDRALHFSYQSAEIERVGDEQPLRIRALINANQLKPDYDDKIVSVGFEHGFAPGQIFKWLKTNTYWIIYSQDLTELAYFKGDIRKCNYEIRWEDENNKIQSTRVALRGPVETKINFIQKNGINLDIPNHSLHILMPKTEATLAYFKRYSKFYISGADSNTKTICWRVEAIDTLSMPGVLEINAVEYYSNLCEDDVENGIVGNLIVDSIEPAESLIIGEQLIKPKREYVFTYVGSNVGEWQIDDTLPIQYQTNGTEITVKWTATYSGQFTLSYGDEKRIILVDSMF